MLRHANFCKHFCFSSDPGLEGTLIVQGQQAKERDMCAGIVDELVRALPIGGSVVQIPLVRGRSCSHESQPCSSRASSSMSTRSSARNKRPTKLPRSLEKNGFVSGDALTSDDSDYHLHSSSDDEVQVMLSLFITAICSSRKFRDRLNRNKSQLLTI